MNNSEIKNPDILWEDEDLLVINKPAGMVVNNAKSASGLTVQQWMTARQGEDYMNKILSGESQSDWMSLLPDDFSDEYGSAAEIFRQRGFIVHRLDKDTSGVLLLAKNPGSMISLMSQFQKRQIQKHYQCLVHGQMVTPTDTIKLPIMRSVTHKHRFNVDPGGRVAETKYQVIKEYTFDQSQFLLRLKRLRLPVDAEFERQLDSYQAGFSLINCFPKTGRTHQIRVHFSFLNHPLVGDSRYAGKRRQRLDAAWCPRHFLHAENIHFTHPRSGEKIEIQAPLPDDLLTALSVIETSE